MLSLDFSVLLKMAGFACDCRVILMDFTFGDYFHGVVVNCRMQVSECPPVFFISFNSKELFFSLVLWLSLNRDNVGRLFRKGRFFF